MVEEKLWLFLEKMPSRTNMSGSAGRRSLFFLQYFLNKQIKIRKAGVLWINS